MLKRFIRFGLVGGTGVLVDMTILFLLADPRTLGWNLSLSKAIAAEIAILNNFIWNDLWTFRDFSADQLGWRSRSHRFGKFNLICLAGIAFNILILNAEVRWLHLNVYVANFVAIFLVSLWNFWMNLTLGWGGQPPATRLPHSTPGEPGMESTAGQMTKLKSARIDLNTGDSPNASGITSGTNNP